MPVSALLIHKALMLRVTLGDPHRTVCGVQAPVANEYA
ncbi:hypothetical protein ACPOL_3589 [Acidisarcina polymorpha]|uniref:Uncharacterized protein n=1 Tax=Acidisarcina polymorpha TaxID=2211140 RepID=A0A2Z5G247_9BACT|nr:hypothetical protein ACPOL_3589 [Acidisarcina polymorpha]